MPQATIRIEGLGKRFRVGGPRAPYGTFRDSLAGIIYAPVRWARSFPRNGRSGADPAQTFWALKDISLQIAPGEVVGVVGRNGAGKSTLLKILSRITEPTRGYAEIIGRVGSLLEVGTGFHAELTGRENVYLNGVILGMTRQEVDRKFDEIVEFAEVAPFIDTAVKHYSSGMQLRLGFAVAAHLQTEILLMDEVLAVGDASFQKKCLGKVGRVADEGRTVLFVSHNIAAIRELCTRAVWLDGGQVTADGEVPETTQAYIRSLSNNSFSYVSRDYGLTIHRVALRNARGETCTAFAPGEDLVIEVSFTATRPISHPQFTLVVDSLGGPCFSANMMLDGRVPESISGAGRVACTFKSLPLLPQSYTIRLRIKAHDGQNVIVPLQDVASFDVAARLEDYGFRGEFYTRAGRSTAVVVPYQWTMPDGTTHHIELKSLEGTCNASR
jgi:lipopolysaccharide transport system ATP-binding protein